MGAFSDLAIDIEERKQAKRSEWAVLFDDEKRPATLWRVIGEARGFYLLRNAQGEEITRPLADCWVIL